MFVIWLLSIVIFLSSVLYFLKQFLTHMFKMRSPTYGLVPYLIFCFVLIGFLPWSTDCTYLILKNVIIMKIQYKSRCYQNLSAFILKKTVIYSTTLLINQIHRSIFYLLGIIKNKNNNRWHSVFVYLSFFDLSTKLKLSKKWQTLKEKTLSKVEISLKLNKLV